MIDVVIRHDFEASGVFLCTWAADELDGLLPSIGEWGVVTEAGEYFTDDLSGQIRLDASHAYFEVIIDTEDDS